MSSKTQVFYFTTPLCSVAIQSWVPGPGRKWDFGLRKGTPWLLGGHQCPPSETARNPPWQVGRSSRGHSLQPVNFFFEPWLIPGVPAGSNKNLPTGVGQCYLFVKDVICGAAQTNAGVLFHKCTTWERNTKSLEWESRLNAFFVLLLLFFCECFSDVPWGRYLLVVPFPWTDRQGIGTHKNAPKDRLLPPDFPLGSTLLGVPESPTSPHPGFWCAFCLWCLANVFFYFFFLGSRQGSLAGCTQALFLGNFF